MVDGTTWKKTLNMRDLEKKEKEEEATRLEKESRKAAETKKKNELLKELDDFVETLDDGWAKDQLTAITNRDPTVWPRSLEVAQREMEFFHMDPDGRRELNKNGKHLLRLVLEKLQQWHASEKAHGGITSDNILITLYVEHRFPKSVEIYGGRTDISEAEIQSDFNAIANVLDAIPNALQVQLAPPSHELAEFMGLLQAPPRQVNPLLTSEEYLGIFCHPALWESMDKAQFILFFYNVQQGDPKTWEPRVIGCGIWEPTLVQNVPILAPDIPMLIDGHAPWGDDRKKFYKACHLASMEERKRLLPNPDDPANPIIIPYEGGLHALVYIRDVLMYPCEQSQWDKMDDLCRLFPGFLFSLVHMVLRENDHSLKGMMINRLLSVGL